MDNNSETNRIYQQVKQGINDKSIFEKAKNYAYQYIDEVKERAVTPDSDAINDLSMFDETLPETMGNEESIIDMLHEYGEPAAVSITGGKYFGFVCGSSMPVTVASRWMADVWDQNSGLYVMSPLASKLEDVCEKWVVSLLGLPKDTAAGFVSGSSIANICALTIARNELLKKQGWNINEKGLFGAPEIRVVLGEQAHSSVFKALSIIGLGSKRIELIPVDKEGRIKADKMPVLDENTLLILQAGQVNTGAFDDFTTLCEMGNKAGAWVHIDGAFGLWAAASTKLSYLTKGIEKADSWCVDAHKTLNVPYDCGIVLCRNRKAFINAMQASGSYIQYSNNRDSMLYGMEMSKRARGIELWTALKYLGRKGVEELVESLCDNAVYFADCLSREGFSIENNVVYNQVLVSCQSDEKTLQLLSSLQESRKIWCGKAIHNNKIVIRLSICSWMTTRKDIDECVELFKNLREELDN